MLRADLLDAMDYMMQTVGKTTPFGGVQVLFIGDLQLPPVIRDEEWRTLRILEILFHSHVVQNPPLY
jgi:hypothetical protein